MHLDHQTAHPHQNPICLPNLMYLKCKHLQYPQLIPNTMNHLTEPKVQHDRCNTAMSYEGLICPTSGEVFKVETPSM